MTKGNNSKNEKGSGLFSIAAFAAGVAAGYFLYGKDGAKNRKKVKGWMLKAKGEVLERLEKLKDIDEEDYNKIIDSVSAKYSKMKSLDKDEVAKLMDDLRVHWKSIEKKLEPKKKKARAAITKSASSVKRKVTKKIHEKTAIKKSSAGRRASSKKRVAS